MSGPSTNSHRILSRVLTDMSQDWPLAKRLVARMLMEGNALTMEIMASKRKTSVIWRVMLLLVVMIRLGRQGAYHGVHPGRRAVAFIPFSLCSPLECCTQRSSSLSHISLHAGANHIVQNNIQGEFRKAKPSR